MQYSISLTGLLATFQTFLEYMPMSNVPSAHLPSSQVAKSQFRVINQGIHLIIATEFGARASVMLRTSQYLSRLGPQNRHRDGSMGREIIAVIAGEDGDGDEPHDEVLCSSAVINNCARMDTDAFDDVRRLFCESANGTLVPVGKSLNLRIVETESHRGRWSGVTGMVENNGGSLEFAEGSRNDAHLVDEGECLKATEVFVKKTGKNCQKDGFAQGGLTSGATPGVKFVLFPVENE